jgi:beta-lactamase class A
MRVAGGGGEIQAFLKQIGINDIKVANTEKEIGRDWETQYQNWATPTESIGLLRWLEASVRTGSGSDRVPGADGETPDGNSLLIQLLTDSVPGRRRLKRLLPADAVVSHKTGTSGTKDEIASATNDIGIITLPDGKHLAIAVFVSDSSADPGTREAVIAKIAKAGWDRWAGTPQP